MNFKMKIVVATLALNVLVAILAHAASAQYMNQLGGQQLNTFDYSANVLHPPAPKEINVPMPEYKAPRTYSSGVVQCYPGVNGTMNCYSN
jgi:hypothetical protein